MTDAITTNSSSFVGLFQRYGLVIRRCSLSELDVVMLSAVSALAVRVVCLQRPIDKWRTWEWMVPLRLSFFCIAPALQAIAALSVFAVRRF